jgi:iron complex transport system ATP-binding protein
MVAVVPQRVSSDIQFTVQELVLMGRSPHLGWLDLEKPKDLELALEAMAITDVAHLAPRPLPQLSGGELQRVIIARALCQQPRLLLLDEPTAALDPAHQVNIMDLMARLQQERGLTVIMVSHDLNLAAMYGDQLLLLKEGRRVSSGSPGEVLTYEKLEQAYGCALLVDENPLGKVPRVNLVPKKFLQPRDP